MPEPTVMQRVELLLQQALTLLKNQTSAEQPPEPSRRGRGRPRKNPLPEQPSWDGRDARTIGETNIPDATHPDVAAEAAASDAELEARVQMRRMREQGLIDTGDDDDLIG